jgi:uncharacterized protein YndB with AHSA1/START domain
MTPRDSYALAAPEGGTTIEISRWFAAPPETLWRMYTDPVHLVQFYGSPGCTHPVCEIDLRPGGQWRHTLRVADGREFPSLSTFLEIDPPNRFVYEWTAVPDPVFGPVLPPKTVNTMEFRAENGGCRVLARVECVSTMARDGMVRSGFGVGIRESMERLDDYLRRSAA